MMGPGSYFLLIANSLWDLASTLSIFMRDTVPACSSVADAHLAMWTDEADRESRAAGVLFAFLLAHWAYLRALAALGEWVEIAVWTYVAEAALFVSLAGIGRMHARPALGSAALCAAAVVVLLNEAWTI